MTKTIPKTAYAKGQKSTKSQTSRPKQTEIGMKQLLFPLAFDIFVSEIVEKNRKNFSYTIAIFVTI